MGVVLADNAQLHSSSPILPWLADSASSLLSTFFFPLHRRNLGLTLNPLRLSQVDEIITKLGNEQEQPFSIGWYLGIKSGDAYQINRFDRFYGDELDKGPPGIQVCRKLCPEKGNKL